MSQHHTREAVAERATLHSLVRPVPEADRSFNLPTSLYVATVGLYFGFLTIMGIGFGNPEMVLPMAIFVIFLGAFFGIAALFVRIDPQARGKILPWHAFRSRGIDTLTGRLPMKDAVVQVLILPVLIVLWGLATATIAALV